MFCITNKEIRKAMRDYGINKPTPNEVDKFKEHLRSDVHDWLRSCVKRFVMLKVEGGDKSESIR